MNKATYYALCHEARLARYAERQRRRTKRELKRAHKAWAVNRALAIVRASSMAVYDKAQRMGAIYV